MGTGISRAQRVQADSRAASFLQAGANSTGSRLQISRTVIYFPTELHFALAFGSCSHPRSTNERSDAHGHVSPKHMIPDLRDGLTGALVTRGTSEACASLRIADLVSPAQRIWIKWRHHEALKNAFRRAWTARTSSEILAIARDFRAVTIDTANDLLDAVLASLERLQHRLQIAESAEAHALWNEPGQSSVSEHKREIVSSFL